MSRTLPLRRIGRTDLVVPALGIGTGQWVGRNPLHPPSAALRQRLERTVAEALGRGLRLFDSAETYGLGRTERLLGATLAGTDDVFVSTKYFPFPHRLRADAVARAVSGSLRRLGRTHIDLYQVHWPSSLMSEQTLMRALAREVERGRVRAIGVSNHSAAQVRRAARLLAAHGVALASNQVHYSLLHRAPELDGLLQTCRELDVTVLCTMPLERGLLARRPDPETGGPGPVLAALADIAAGHGADVSQVALSWLLAKPDLVVLAGARQPEHAASHAAALNLVLTDAEIDRLETVSRPWLRAPGTTR